MSLDIPPYQRSYAWSKKNVDQLVNDIRRFHSSGHYRIGTFILNPSLEQDRDALDSEDRRLDIVDGQQRYLSFALIVHALLSRREEISDGLVEELRASIAKISIPVRNDGRSEINLRENYLHIGTLVARWSPHELREFTEFFLKNCSVVVLEVRDLDSAFQMFDSQNTRGRPLFPTDLLKAYHLRELHRTNPSRELMLSTVKAWEAVEPEEINHVIANVLFPIKLWTVNEARPRKGFTSDHVSLFKGIREGVQGNGRFRWALQALLAKGAVDRFRQDNATLLSHHVIEELDFPFQLTQPIIDGEMFFRMVHHYVVEARRAGIERTAIRGLEDASRHHDPKLNKILTILNSQPSGVGNRYVRELFDCLLMAYLDRFGWHDIETAARALAQHCYLLRIHLRRVQMNSIDLHALGKHERVKDLAENLFAKIGHALDPNVVLSLVRPHLDSDPIPSNLRSLYLTDAVTTDSEG